MFDKNQYLFSYHLGQNNFDDKVIIILGLISIVFKLTPPNPIIEANAGFHGEMSMEKGVNETFEQELAWTVDNSIEVPSGYVTKAQLEIQVNDVF